MQSEPLPVPPLEMRCLVGPIDPAAYENSSGDPVIPRVAEESYGRVFDFGCGCGRLARQLAQQRRRPERYVGIDLHKGMIDWCAAHLSPRVPGFEFYHHDVLSHSYNAGATDLTLPFPVGDAEFSLIIAWSVFTHLVERQVAHYLEESARILEPSGTMLATFFLMDKREFPMLTEENNALYMSYEYPELAVILDREWLLGLARDAGLKVTAAVPPPLRNFQWHLYFRHASHPSPEVTLPPDTADLGSWDIIRSLALNWPGCEPVTEQIAGAADPL